MIKKLLALDGVMVVCQFRDDGTLVEAHGMGEEDMMLRLAKFAYDFKRMVQANADQLSMFTQMSGWAPSQGWVVRGPELSACSVGNLVCIISSGQASLTEVMTNLAEVAHW